jgi:hypothetical protein
LSDPTAAKLGQQVDDRRVLGVIRILVGVDFSPAATPTCPLVDQVERTGQIPDRFVSDRVQVRHSAQS